MGGRAVDVKPEFKRFAEWIPPAMAGREWLGLANDTNTHGRGKIAVQGEPELRSRTLDVARQGGLASLVNAHYAFVLDGLWN